MDYVRNYVLKYYPHLPGANELNVKQNYKESIGRQVCESKTEWIMNLQFNLNRMDEMFNHISISTITSLLNIYIEINDGRLFQCICSIKI